MKKTITRLALFLVLAALLVTGVVFSASAENTVGLAQAVGGDKNHVFFSGTRPDGLSTAGTYEEAILTRLPADKSFWPIYDENGTKISGGDSLWIDAEFYYDKNVKTEYAFRLRSNAVSGISSAGHAAFASIKDGKLTWDTAYAKPIDGDQGLTLLSYGWHHLTIRITQSTVLDATAASGTKDTVRIDIYLNGELRSSAIATAKWFDIAWNLYESSAPAGAVSESEIVYSENRADLLNTSKLRFYFYTSGVYNQNAARIWMMRDIYYSYGDTPRVNYAPIKLIGDGVVPLAPTSSIEAFPGRFKATVHPDYTVYDVIDFENFYEIGDTDASITLPGVSTSDGVIFGGWYADADYTRPITKVTAAANSESGVTAYVRVIVPAYEAKSYAAGSVFKSNKIANKETVLQLGEFTIGPNSANFAPLWLDLDYYVDPAATNGFEFRLTDSDAYTDGVAAGKISSGTTWAYKKALFTIKGQQLVLNSAFFPSDATADLGGEGWHHISIKYEQIASYADGAVTSEYLFTVYVDGTEKLETKVSKQTFAADHYYYLYKTSYDAEAGKIVYTPNSNLRMYYYSSGIFSSLPERVWMIGEFYATYGEKSPFEGYAAIEYNLNGGSLAFDKMDGWEFDNPGSSTFFPLKADGTLMTFASDNELKACTAGSYAAWQYSVTAAKYFYMPGEDYVLPEATLAGMDFLGWYDNADFAGQPITKITADQVGKIELYARFEGKSKVTLNIGGEETYLGKHNFFTLPETAELWLDSDGCFWTAGEVAELGADITFYAVTVSLRDGASIRMDGEHSGIRFEAEFGTELLKLLAENGYEYELGVLITPTDLLAGEFTFEGLAGIEHQVISANGIPLSEQGSASVLYASLIDILAQNYTRAFSARAYIKIKADEELVAYSDYDAEKNSRSIYEVAKAAYSDIPYGYTDEQLAIIKSYIDGVLVLDEELLIKLEPITARGYASPYTVSYVDGKLMIKKSAEQMLATILVGDTAYIDGWTTSDDGTTVIASFTVDSDDATVDDDLFGEGFGENFEN